MDIKIRQYSPNQGVIVNIYSILGVVVKKVTRNGATVVIKVTKGFSWKNIADCFRVKKTRRWVISALAIVLTGIMTLTFLTRDILENRLYDKYYRRFDKGSWIMFSNSDFNEATERYEQGDAVAAWFIMKNLPDSYTIQRELILYRALSSMDIEHYQEAIRYFETLSALPDNQNFIAIAKWYQGLCYLRTKNIKAAENAFSNVTPLHPEEYKKAQKILKRLKNHTEIK
jgi:tetratricopeptide (TPR) repeat protein